MRFFTSLLALCLSLTLTLSLSAQQVIITGIVDGTVSATPRAVELYVSGTVDLNGYALARFANSNTEETDRFTLTNAGTFTNAFVYLVNDQHLEAFATAFGTGGDFANVIPGTNLFGNGNDAFQLVDPSGNVIDQTGGVIGNGDDFWEDSWLYRVNNTGPDGDWVEANWLNWNSNDALDGLSLAEIGAAVPFGTYTAMPAGPSATVAARGELREPDTDGGFTVTLSEAAPSDLTVIYTLEGTATEGQGGDYLDPTQSNLRIPAGELTGNIDLTVLDDNENEGPETITITLTGTDNNDFSASGSATLTLIDDEGAPVRLIHEIQGTGLESPLAGQTVNVIGIVVGDFQGGEGEGLGGFYVQEEDTDADSDPSTSEGVFVTTDSDIEVNVGDLVEVIGVVREQQQVTTIVASGSEGGVVRLGTDQPLPTAAPLNFPLESPNVPEALEGMRTTVPQSMAVTSAFNLGRYGAFEVALGDRLVQYTECNAPSALGQLADVLEKSRRRLLIDDGRTGNNTLPIPLPGGGTLGPDNTLRAGTTYTGLTGIMDERDFVGGGVDFNYHLQLAGVESIRANERPAAAPDVGGNVKVVSMNVLNYFTTLNRRGANDADELARQQAKIVAAICELDADVIGLAEIENNGFGNGSALQTLIAAIEAGCELRYTAVQNPNSGSDEIQVALIYKADVLRETGTAANLSTPADLFESNRIPLAQTFTVVETGNPDIDRSFTVCMNHWKSKGGSCGTGDDDDGGAGSCAGTRTRVSAAIRDWLTTNPTGTSDQDVILMGDLNAYTAEAPVQNFVDEGYVNAIVGIGDGLPTECGLNASFVFRGEWGNLDHILVSPTLAPQVTAAAIWAVNAEEPPVLDYDTRFNDPSLYAADFYRFSDHNPLVIGLDLEMTTSTTEATPGRMMLTRLNPTTLRLQHTAPNVTYRLLDTTGKLVLRGKTTAETTQISVGRLPAGVYFLHLGTTTFKVLL